MGQPPVLLLSPRFLLSFRRGRPPGRPVCRHLRVIRRAGCPQPAARQPPHHRGGVWSPRATGRVVGADAPVRPLYRTPGKACGPCPTKRPVGRDPCVPPPITAAFPATCHCEPVADVTGVSIRPPTPCLSSRVLSSHRITSISNPPCSARYVWGAGRIRFHRPTPCRPFSAARRNLA